MYKINAGTNYYGKKTRIEIKCFLEFTKTKQKCLTDHGDLLGDGHLASSLLGGDDVTGRENSKRKDRDRELQGVCRAVWFGWTVGLGGKHRAEDGEGGCGGLVFSSPSHFPVRVQLSGKDC